MSGGQRSWANLHPEVLNLIRQRLLREDYLNFRATCQNWNFKALFDPLVYENLKHPFLLNFSKHHDDDQGPSSCCEAYSYAYNKSYHIRANAKLTDAQIHCSSYGWLLCSRGRRTFFYHPSTESKINLPLFEPGQYFTFNRMGFSAPPTSPDCVVFALLDMYCDKSVYTAFTQRGRRSWTHSGDDPVPNLMRWAIHRSRKLIFTSDRQQPPKVMVVRDRYKVNPAKCLCIGEFLWSNSCCPPVFYKGAFCCLAQDGRLGVFKHKRNLWGLFDRTCRPDLFADNPRNECYLMECRGDLMSIVVGPMGEFVRVLRFCEPRRTWQVAYHVKDQMVFLSPAGCVVLPCDDEALKNTIHFPRFGRGNRHVFYSLSTERFHSLKLEEDELEEEEEEVEVLGKFESAHKLEEDEEEEEVKVKNDAIVMLWRDGDKQWTVVHSPPDEQGFELIGGVVFHQGKVYGYPKETIDLVSIELEPERYTTKIVPEVDFRRNFNGSNALVRLLVELDGELYLFVKYEAGCTWTKQVDIAMDIRVFKLDSEMMRWIKVDDLGDRAYFWSSWGCYQCCASKLGLERNTIYFISQEKDLYIFDYGERSITGFRPAASGDVDDDNWFPDGFIMCRYQ
ncbi:unnamed protein product [Linum tenue]|uniref:KIB1-4 beta-propeller domain-containing protein n=1 Tax=Linum tenue TaxID=586396 RepID=A0AAV0HYT8_9ROSI|nr:unnamed protein product [Linum tenue]